MFSLRISAVQGRASPLGSAPQSGATMTNANVEHVEDVEIKDIKGRLIGLKYKDGAVKVLVPPNIPLVKRVRSDRSALKNGVEVSLQASPKSRRCSGGSSNYGAHRRTMSPVRRFVRAHHNSEVQANHDQFMKDFSR